MKIIFIVILYLLCIAAILQSRFIIKKARESLKKIVPLMIMLVINGLVYSIILFVTNKTAAEIFYAVYFSCNSVVMLLLLFFCLQFTAYEKKNKSLSAIPFFLVLVDIITLISLEIFGSFISLVEKPVLYSRSIWAPGTITPYFNVHILLEYGLILMVLIILLIKCLTSPKEMKGRFAVIFYGLCIGLILKTVLLIMNPTLDPSVILYLILAISIYYVDVKCFEENLNLSTVMAVFSEMDDLLMFFDPEHNCSFVNKKVRDMLKLPDPKKYCSLEFQKWVAENPGFNDWMTEAHNWDAEIEKNGKTTYLKIRAQKNYDEMGNYLGCYFQTRDNSEATRTFKESQKRLMLDPLTMIYKREYFFDKVKEIILKESDKKYSLICTNIVDFSTYNSIFGEERGNQVLRRNGDLIRNMQEVTAAYGRVYGDIFGILVEAEKYSESYLSGMVKRLKDEFGGKNYNLRIMVGVYDIDNVHEPVSSMCDKACIAIATHKQEYNRIICRYNQWDYDETLNESVIMSRFQQALDSGQFHVFIQPQVTIDEQIIGGEALSRWIDKDEKMIPPDDFIPVLEKNGAIYKLDQHVWEEAAKTLAKWKKKGREELYISVNISAKDFYYIDIYEVFTGLVKKYNIEPSKLKLEITESVIAQDSYTINEIIQKLRKFGFDIEIDDFGSGYSSLGMLKDIVVDVLKLDMSFLRKSTTTQEERMWGIMEQIVRMAEALGMDTVVEGVETKEIAGRLTDMGCRIFQGFFYAKPESLADFEKRANI